MNCVKIVQSTRTHVTSMIPTIFAEYVGQGQLGQSGIVIIVIQIIFVESAGHTHRGQLGIVRGVIQERRVDIVGQNRHT